MGSAAGARRTFEALGYFTQTQGIPPSWQPVGSNVRVELVPLASEDAVCVSVISGMSWAPVDWDADQRGILFCTDLHPFACIVDFILHRSFLCIPCMHAIGDAALWRVIAKSQGLSSPPSSAVASPLSHIPRTILARPEPAGACAAGGQALACFLPHRARVRDSGRPLGRVRAGQSAHHGRRRQIGIAHGRPRICG